MKNTLRRALVVLLAVLLLTASASADYMYQAKVYRCKWIPVFSNKVFDEEHFIGAMKKGTHCEVLEVDGIWSKDSLNGNEGYTGTAYLERVRVQSPDEKSRGFYYTQAPTLVYSNSSMSSQRVGFLGKGELVLVWGGRNGYSYLRNRSGSVVGFAYSGSLGDIRPVMP